MDLREQTTSGACNGLPLSVAILLLNRCLRHGYEILQQHTVYEDIPTTNFPKKDASCRIGEEAYISCLLDEMLLSRLLFLWQMLTCFLIRLIPQIQSPFSFRQVPGQPRTCLSDQVLRTPTVHTHSCVHTATHDQAPIRADADRAAPALMRHAGDFLARGTPPDPHGLVPAATHDQAAIRADADRPDLALM